MGGIKENLGLENAHHTHNVRSTNGTFGEQFAAGDARDLEGRKIGGRRPGFSAYHVSAIEKNTIGNGVHAYFAQFSITCCCVTKFSGCEKEERELDYHRLFELYL